MKTQRFVKILVALAMAAGLVTYCWAKDEDEALALSQLPSAVQTTIKTNVEAADIKCITKEDYNGKPAYEVEAIKCDLTIAEDGTLLMKAVEITWAEVPEAVRKTVAEQAGDGKVEKIEWVSEDGRIVYEARIKKAGKDVEITVGRHGKLIEFEESKEAKDSGKHDNKDK